MTVDNGGEFWQHQKLPVKTYFCDPHSPWQRGSIENANGVLRRYLPRKVRINQFNPYSPDKPDFSCREIDNLL
jgi:IS30 family transposase